jgi:LmbE family N-acetylglucosaminyl deacetylase
MLTAKKILIIAAHPDDEVLGCGGSIPRWVDAGASVCVQILGEGITSRPGSASDADLLALHHERAKKAGASLGVEEVFLERIPDQRFDTVALLDITQRIEALIARLRPDCVYTQHGGDLNMDHVLTFRAAMTATRPMSGSSVRALLAYPVASSTEWSFGQFEPRFSPNTFSDISTTLERKIAAMQVYESETRAFPHPRSPEALRATAAHWGSAVGVAAAEPFQVVWQRE